MERGHDRRGDPTHRGPTQRGGPHRGPDTGGEGHTGDPHRTHTDKSDRLTSPTGGAGSVTGCNKNGNDSVLYRAVEPDSLFAFSRHFSRFANQFFSIS